ncbi:MAG TPA: methylenetetrahydrofolate reductase [NAD(P)H] [Spirochaetes bacterium]|nr:methylenetetrahydrofolate reductase [NAD(P)H] [Spirochaetota bacterium]
MKIHELYRDRFTLSFEIFPPKTPAGEEKLMEALAVFAAHDPGFISVTYGAGGSTREKTLELSLKIRDRFGITPLAHFTCVGAGRKDIADYLGEVKRQGIENILALRGDPPQGEKEFTPAPDGFAHADELVAYIRSINGFTIGVAGYPEGHMEAPDLDTDIENLKKKVDAGADFIITQLFYHNEDFYTFIDKITKLGITVPVIPGIMPVTSMAQVERVTGMCGAKVPGELIERLKRCATEDQLCAAGVEYSIKQCEELRSWGVRGFHFYPLNKSAAVARILASLNPVL